MTADENDLQHGDCIDFEVSDSASASKASRVEHTASGRGKLSQYRNVYDGKGEYEFATAHHYVP